MESVCRIHIMGDLHLVLWLHTAGDHIDAGEWEESMAMISGHLAKHSVPVEQRRGLVVSDGQAPNSKQRAELNEKMWDGRRGKNAVVTTVLENPIKRGIATALTWLNPDFRFYRPEGFDEALAYLDLSARRAEVWSKFAPMQLLLSPIQTLGLVAKATGLPRLTPATSNASVAHK